MFTTNKTEAVYTLLRERIVNGTYSPGYRLNIDQLARDSGISAIPWREAIRRLEAQGWIETEQNIGARVAVFEREALEQTVTVLSRLEGLATAEALVRMTSKDITVARRINDRMRTSLDRFVPAAFTAMNREFHFVFYDRCGNTHLRELIANEWSKLEIIRRPPYALAPGRAQESVAEHDHLIELLSTLDPTREAEVEAFAQQHKLNSLRAVTARPTHEQVLEAQRDTSETQQPTASAG